MDRYCCLEAKRELDHLRRGTENYAFALANLRVAVCGGGLLLAEIGTSEEELEQLKIQGCKFAAQERLECLRTQQQDAYNIHCDIQIVRDEARKGGFSLEEVGTSEQELASFARVQVA